VLPVIATVLFITTAILGIAFQVTKRVSEDQQTFIMRNHGTRVRGIVGQAMAELVSAGLAGQAEVIEVQRKLVVDQLRSYWKSAGVEGVIFEAGRPLVATVPVDEVEWLRARIPSPEHPHQDESPQERGPDDLHRYRGFTYVGMNVTCIPAWNWNVVTVSRPISLLSRNRSIFLLLPLTALGMLLLGAVIAIVLRRNLQQPVQRVLNDLHVKGEVEPTGVAELDDIGGAVNRAVEALAVRNTQLGALHDIALSLQSSTDMVQMLQMLLDKGAAMLDATHAGLALFSLPEGRMTSLYRTGSCVEDTDIDPRCSTLYGAIRRGGAPVVLHDPAADPVYGDMLASCCTRFDNVIACPVSSSAGYMDAVLLFANRRGGIVDGDDRLVRTLAADAMMAIDRLHDINLLARFKRLVESTFDMVLIADDEGKIVYANPSGLEITGFTSDEITRTSLPELHPDDTPAADGGMAPILASGRTWSGELWCRRRDGSRFRVSASIFPMAGGEHGRNLVASIERDISRERNLYEHLLRAQKMEAVGTLAGGFAHEFNNILAGILGHAELMLMQLDGAHPLQEAAAIIRASALRGADLARRILSVAPAEEMAVVAIDVNEIVLTTLELARHGMPAGIDIVSRLADGLPRVNADPGQIHQVIMNLLVNSRDAMPGGGTLTVETALEEVPDSATQARREHVRITVADTGTGIPLDLRHRVFDPFFTTKDPGKGTGLGLYVVNSIVANHGGRVDLESEEGKGASFSVLLPAGPGAPSGLLP
jgi:PAS domain S-box-containing protein